MGNRVTIIQTFETVSITKKMYGWTKYGGATLGFSQTLSDVWYCQFCGDRQVKELPCYLIPMDLSERDFIRACSSCKHTQVKAGATTVGELLKLIEITRRD